MNFSKKLPVNYINPFLIFPLVILILCVGGLIYYNHQEKLFESIINDQLDGIAKSKIIQIDTWLKERESDVEFIHDNKQFHKDILKFVTNTQSKPLKNELNNWLTVIKKYHDYSNIYIINNNGKIIFSLQDSTSQLSSHDVHRALSTFKNDKISYSNLKMEKTNDKIFLDYRVPIVVNKNSHTSNLAVVIFRIDPQKDFFPVVSSWPFTSYSAESYLVKREGNYAVYLSKLKKIKNAALNFKTPISVSNNVAVKAILGKTGILEGFDYNKDKVIAEAHKIPNSDWYLISKVNRAEIFAPIHQKALLVFLVIILLIIIMGLTSYFIWKFQKHKTENLKKINALEKQALLKHFNYLMKYANDIFILSDDQGKIVNVNDTAVKTYGYTAEEFKNLSLHDLVADQINHNPFLIMDEIVKKDGLVFESLNKRKNGETFPIESSARAIDIGGVRFFQSIIRDITERKNYQANLIKLNRIYAVLSNINQLIVRSRDKEEILAEACNIAINDGKFRFAVVGLKNGNNSKYDIIASSGFDDGYSSIMNISLNDPDYCNGPAVRSVKLKHYVVSNNIEDDPIMAPWREDALKRGYYSLVSFPLMVNKIALGFMVFYSEQVNYFQQDELKLLEELASDISFALEFIEINKRINESEIQLRSIWENSIDAMRLCDKNGIILNVNNAYCNLFGISKSDLILKKSSISYYLGEKSKEDFSIAFMNRNIDAKIERKIKRNNSEDIWAEISNSFIEIKNEPALLLSIFRDITFRKKAEIALRKSEEKFSKAFINGPDGIIISKLEDGKIIEVNNKFLDLLCINRAEAIGKTTLQLNIWVKPEDRIEFINILKKDDTVEGFEKKLRKSDGQIIYVLISANIIEIDSEIHILSIIQDITTKKIAEKKLIEAKEKAEEMNRLKNSFLANMSHELRTPMIGILGYAELLQTELGNVEHKQMIDSLHQSASRLLNTLNLILDLASVEANKKEVIFENIDLAHYVIEHTQTFAGLAKNQNLTLTYRIKDQNVYSYLDPIIFGQILDNLISNAIKYTPKGSIIIEVDSEVIESQKWSIVNVIDTGIGIPKDSLGVIFDEFRQVSEGYSRKFEGTGLGLTLTKKFIEMMHGTISVKSESGKGSEFMVKFPSSST